MPLPSTGASARAEPKMAERVAASGGGMGYMPRLISTRERPRDHRSDATEYWEPWKWKKKDGHRFL